MQEIKESEGRLAEMVDLSISELARLCGMGPSTISRILSGKRSMSVDVALKIALPLGITVEDLIKLINYRRKNPKKLNRGERKMLAQLNPKWFYDLEKRPVKLCACGCGYPLNSKAVFVSGHSNKVHSIFSKVDANKLPFTSLPPDLKQLYVAYRAYPLKTLAEIAEGVRDGSIKPEEYVQES